MSSPLDAVDLHILDRLQRDARIANVDLAKQVHLSPSPCLSRVRRLEQSGIVKQYVALLDPRRLGLTVSVFIQVSLEKQVESALEVFENSIGGRPEVMECYLMTGDADYLLRVVVPDLQSLERFILDHLTKIPGVASIKSSFALKQVKYQTALPLDHVDRSGDARLVSTVQPATSQRRRDAVKSARARGASKGRG